MFEKYEWHPRAPSRREKIAWAITITASLLIAIAHSFGVRILGRDEWAIILAITVIQIALAYFGPKVRRR
jgi:hypothetical protein